MGVAALCWTLMTGTLACSSPMEQAYIQDAFKFANENMDHTKATQVVIVYPNSAQWKTVLQQHPEAVTVLHPTK